MSPLPGCPPATCSRTNALGSLAAGVSAAVVGAAVGTIVVAARGRSTKAQWPWALLAAVITAAAGVSGFAGLFASV